jgi:hypothetical protein
MDDERAEPCQGVPLGRRVIRGPSDPAGATGSGSSGIRKLTLNARTGTSGLARDLLRALNDPRILTEKGGFLFKARLEADDPTHLILGVTPCLLDWQRTYHYDTRLPGEDAYTITGTVTPGLVFELLFNPPAAVLTEHQRCLYARLFVVFARFMLEQGLRPGATLGIVTRQLIQEAGLFQPPPEDLPALATRVLPSDPGPP